MAATSKDVTRIPGAPLHTLESSVAEAVAGAAQVGIAKVNARIADASARAKEAELRLSQLRTPAAPRRLNHEVFAGELEDKPNARLTCGRPQRGGGDPGT
jgi:hypothetical protein